MEKPGSDDWTKNTNSQTPNKGLTLKQIFTEVYITKEESEDVSEISQIQTAFREPFTPEEPIKYEDIFKPLSGEDQNKKIRTVMTKGVAGTGKTVSTQMFLQDWAEGRANQDIDYVFPLSFRKLNTVKDKEFSLMELLRHFFCEVSRERICNKETKTVFILDGLDESRLPLSPKNSDCSDVTKRTSVDSLLTNLIDGTLLPSACLWITTRPAAANMIPSVDRMTELRGFTDPQKEQFFKKRFFDDENQAQTIWSHISKSQSLHIMCYLPIFCWIAATVLEKILRMYKTVQCALPKTLTAMYIHFIVVQFNHQNVKKDGDPRNMALNPMNIKAILSLGKLAFEQLKKGTLIFYEADLIECGMNTADASEYSGVFTTMFREESGLHEVPVFSFVHLSVQEFIAALYVFLSFNNDGINLMSQETSKWSKLFKKPKKNLYQSAVAEALKSPNGHLDMFLRFLLGLSVKSNQTLLKLLFKQPANSSETNDETVKYIKKKLRENISQEKKMGLLHCLNELNDDSLEKEVQRYLTSGSISKFSPAQWTTLNFMLLSSGRVLDVFDLKKYSASEGALLRLLPVVKASKRLL